MAVTMIGQAVGVSRNDENAGIVLETYANGQVTNTIHLLDEVFIRLMKYWQELENPVYLDPDLEAIQEAAKRPSSVGATVPFQEAEAH